MPIKLTGWGQFIARHCVLTPLSWWQSTLKEITKLQDEDADWELLIEERIHGLQELREKLNSHGAPKYWPIKNTTERT